MMEGKKDKGENIDGVKKEIEDRHGMRVFTFPRQDIN